MMAHVVRLPVLGLAVHDATYYGYRWGLHVGPWLIFIGEARK